MAAYKFAKLALILMIFHTAASSSAEPEEIDEGCPRQRWHNGIIYDSAAAALTQKLVRQLHMLRVWSRNATEHTQIIQASAALVPAGREGSHETTDIPNPRAPSSLNPASVNPAARHVLNVHFCEYIVRRLCSCTRFLCSCLMLHCQLTPVPWPHSAARPVPVVQVLIDHVEKLGRNKSVPADSGQSSSSDDLRMAEYEVATGNTDRTSPEACVQNAGPTWAQHPQLMVPSSARCVLESGASVQHGAKPSHLPT